MIKKIFPLIVLFFAFFSTSYAGIPEEQKNCLEYEIYAFDYTYGPNANAYKFLATINKSYGSDYDIAISWQPRDCEFYGDFELFIPGGGQDFTSLCRGGGNNQDLTALLLLKNLKSGQDYSIFLHKIRNNRRGINEMHICYLKPEAKTIIYDENVLTSRNFNFFENRDDFISFLQFQGGFYMIFLIFLLFVKIITLGRKPSSF